MEGRGARRAVKREELLLKSMFPTLRLTPGYRRTLLLSRSERLNHAGLQPIQLFLRQNCWPQEKTETSTKLRASADLRMPPCSWGTKLRSHSKMETSYCCFGRTSEEPYIAHKTREETTASLSQLLRHLTIMRIVPSSSLCPVSSRIYQQLKTKKADAQVFFFELFFLTSVLKFVKV